MIVETAPTIALVVAGFCGFPLIFLGGILLTLYRTPRNSPLHFPLSLASLGAAVIWTTVPWQLADPDRFDAPLQEILLASFASATVAIVFAAIGAPIYRELVRLFRTRRRR